MSALRLLPACCLAWLLSACAATPEPVAPPAAHAAAGAALLETYWRLVEIDGLPVATPPGMREPDLILKREASRVTGFTGCNTLAGEYHHAGSTLTFGRLATTRMACVREADNAREAAFVTALERTAGYRIAGEFLELRDAAGTLRMRLEARPPR